MTYVNSSGGYPRLLRRWVSHACSFTCFVALLVLIACLISVRLPLYDFELPLEYAIRYFHLYTGFRFIAIVIAPLVALGAILLIGRFGPEPPGPLRTAAAVAMTTAIVTPLAVAGVIGMRALVPGATPLAGSVPELITIVAVGGLLYWSPPALAVMGPLLMGTGWWFARH